MGDLWIRSCTLFAVAAALLLAMRAGSGGESRPAQAPNIYRGDWPTYALPGGGKRDEHPYQLGARQGYRETDVAKLSEMIRAYTARHAANPAEKPDTTEWTFETQIEPAFGRTWDRQSGRTPSEQDHPGERLVIWFAGDGTPGDPYVVGVPCLYFAPSDGSRVLGPGELPQLASTCRIWGEYDPILPPPLDVPDTTRRILARKAIVLGVPTDTQPDLRKRVDLAIALTESQASQQAPLADVYIFAAQAFPQERTYAEKAVREIEKLLDPSIPDAEKDPRAMLRRGKGPVRHADWESRSRFMPNSA